MIQINPHTEPVQASPDIHGAEGSQKPKSEKSEMGVFAKILAGLSGRGLNRKTGTGESAASGVENPDKLPLAELTELDEKDPLSADASIDGAVSGGKGKKLRSGKVVTADKNEAPKNLKNGESEKPSRLDLSDQEKNVLLAVGRLAGQPDEQAGELNGEDGFERLAAELRLGRETVKTETAFAELAQEGGKQPVTLNSVAAFIGEEPAENPKAVNEKAKNRLNPAEIGAKNRFSAGEVGEFQQTEVKKTLSGEKEGKSKVEEARNKKRGPSFEVQDFRSNQQNEAAGKDGAALRVGAETRVSGDSTKEITLELRLPHNAPESSSAITSWEAKAGQAFEDMLARELHQNFNNDIVRHASVALRDNNEGTIRLALKPETLGNVKIRLEMAENRITGHIIVESEEALRAFEREISSLEQAFRDSGFEGANLEMSLAADGREAQQQWQEAEASRFLSGQVAASRYDAAVERMDIPLILDVYQQGTRAVNVLV